ncbi:phosphatase PAP2 family protein [Micromonospora sp. NPDC048843]|uniref:phosphatase PAP2 family protein n=1 Tax=Micromonospora sp. NPDC048843 TaxID=3155389 RepID=UPI0033FFA855
MALMTVAAAPAPALAGPSIRADEIEDVPDITAEWYRDIVEWADTTPGFVQVFMEHFTELSIVLLAAIWALVFWRTRRGPARPMAMMLVGGAAVVLSYGLSEWSKTYLDAERPCRTFPDLPIIANECPPTGDWSFPSNHSTIAAALVAAIFLVSWRMGLLALPIGALAAFSRVFVGVHYPHDVMAGFLIGIVVTTIVVLLFARPATRLAGSLRERPGLDRLLTAGGPRVRTGGQPAGPRG